jgi:beta-lactamase class A
MKLKHILITIGLSTLLKGNIIVQNNQIKQNIVDLIKPFKGTVGLSILHLQSKERIEVNGNGHFPMQSVFKFPLAIAVFSEIDKNKLSLNQKMNLKKSDLLPNTHSPLRDKFPNGNPNISLKQILEATVSLSDNNGCDFLFRLMGGCQPVNNFIHRLGINDMAIVGTEEEMHKDNTLQYKNYASPNAVTDLFALFVNKKTISTKSTEALTKMLIETSTAPNRIKGLLPKSTVVGHKSGWSGGDNKGFTEAINDTGIVYLPNGNSFIITILIKNTTEKSFKSDELAAKITKLAFDHYNKI